MAYTIAVTGKGGVGKTTVAALLVTRLGARGMAPVLAVDADPNTCLDAALGVPPPHSRAASEPGPDRRSRSRPAGTTSLIL